VRTPANGQIFALKKPLSKAAVEAAFELATEKANEGKSSDHDNQDEPS
jgi:hypothetical protein